MPGTDLGDWCNAGDWRTGHVTVAMDAYLVDVWNRAQSGGLASAGAMQTAITDTMATYYYHVTANEINDLFYLIDPSFLGVTLIQWTTAMHNLPAPDANGQFVYCVINWSTAGVGENGLHGFDTRLMNPANADWPYSSGTMRDLIYNIANAVDPINPGLERVTLAGLQDALSQTYLANPPNLISPAQVAILFTELDNDLNGELTRAEWNNLPNLNPTGDRFPWMTDGGAPPGWCDQDFSFFVEPYMSQTWTDAYVYGGNDPQVTAASLLIAIQTGTLSGQAFDITALEMEYMFPFLDTEKQGWISQAHFVERLPLLLKYDAFPPLPALGTQYYPFCATVWCTDNFPHFDTRTLTVQQITDLFNLADQDSNGFISAQDMVDGFPLYPNHPYYITLEVATQMMRFLGDYDPFIDLPRLLNVRFFSPAPGQPSHLGTFPWCNPTPSTDLCDFNHSLLDPFVDVDDAWDTIDFAHTDQNEFGLRSLFGKWNVSITDTCMTLLIAALDNNPTDGILDFNEIHAIPSFPFPAVWCPAPPPDWCDIDTRALPAHYLERTWDDAQVLQGSYQVTESKLRLAILAGLTSGLPYTISVGQMSTMYALLPQQLAVFPNTPWITRDDWVHVLPTIIPDRLGNFPWCPGYIPHIALCDFHHEAATLIDIDANFHTADVMSHNNGLLDTNGLAQFFNQFDVTTTADERDKVIHYLDTHCNPDNQLNLVEMRTMRDQPFPGPWCYQQNWGEIPAEYIIQGSTDAVIEAAFPLFDTNHDGFLTALEFQQGIETNDDLYISTETANTVVLVLDANGDGKLDLNEVKHINKLQVDYDGRLPWNRLCNPSTQPPGQPAPIIKKPTQTGYMSMPAMVVAEEVDDEFGADMPRRRPRKERR